MKGMKTPAGWVALSTLSEADQESLFAKAKIEERLKDENTYNCKWGNNIDCFVNEKDPTKFVLVRDDGGYFKVDAKFMVWYPFTREDQTTDIGAQALWSFTSLKKTLVSLMTVGTTVSDPDYQT